MPAVLLRLRLVVFVLLYLPFHSLSYGYSALNGTYYLPDKDYDDKPGWSVGVNMPRKSCLTFTFFEGDAMLMLGGDHSRGDLNFFAMMSGKTWKYVGDKKYAVEVHYDGDLSWEGKGFGVEVSGYKGVTIENLTADDVGRFARGNGLSLVVNGKTQARFSLDGAQDAVHRMLACALEVEAGRVPLDPTPSIIPSLDARNHPETAVAQASKPPKPDLSPTRPAPKREPAPQRPEEGRDASSPAARYDEGDSWTVDINKGDRVCVIDVSLGEQSLLIHFFASLPGGPTYSATFVDKFPSEKEKYFYEIGGRWVFSSGEATAFNYKGKGYYRIDGLAASFVKDVAQTDALLVRFDATRYGEFDVKGFRRGLGRFTDCVREFGVASAEVRGEPDDVASAEVHEEPASIYDGGDDWTVVVRRAERTCSVTLDYGSREIILGSMPPSINATYFMAFAREHWSPAKDEYELEVVNEAQRRFRVTATAFKGSEAGYAMLDELNQDFVDFLVQSKMLRTKAKGIPPERYDLSSFGHAFERFSDCLEEVRGEASRPKVRRMN